MARLPFPGSILFSLVQSRQHYRQLAGCAADHGGGHQRILEPSCGGVVAFRGGALQSCKLAFDELDHGDQPVVRQLARRFLECIHSNPGHIHRLQRGDARGVDRLDFPHTT